MKKRFLFLISILFVTFLGKAQQNYVPGEITKLNGEVVSGLIDYQEWKINPININFKTTNTSVIKTYSVKDLESFMIAGKKELYQKAVMGINAEKANEDDFVEYESLKEAYLYAKDKVHIDSVFLLALIRGDLNLYSLYDKEKAALFYSKRQ